MQESKYINRPIFTWIFGTRGLKLLTVAMILQPSLGSAQDYLRLPVFSAPAEVELSNTSTDYELKDSDEVAYLDSEAVTKFDRDSSAYTFTWKDPLNKTVEHATWTPRWQFMGYVMANVEIDPQQGFQYNYRVSVHRDSLLGGSVLRILSSALDVEVSSPPGIFGMETQGYKIGATTNVYWPLVPGDDPDGLAPTETRDGFRLSSSGLPSLVACFIRGRAETFSTTSETPPSIAAATNALRGPFQEVARGLTVGPGASEVDVKDVRLYLLASVSQGWLTDVQLLDKFDTMLADADAAVQSKEFVNAADTLHSFCGEVEKAYKAVPQRMTSEAFGLLFYNSQWLAGQFSEK